jgi:hypothetical protein
VERIIAGWLVAGLLATGACSGAPPNTRAPNSRVTVMTQNLYVGADVDAVIAALASPEPADDVPALLTAVVTEDSTAFPVRAGAVAAAIDRRRPDVVGFQEAYDIHVDLTGMGLPYVLDEAFLPAIMDSLAARGLHYVVAAKVASIDATPIEGVHLTDHDAILVNADRVTVESAVGKVYDHNVGPVAPGVTLLSGFVQVGARIGGRLYRFASTHLESDVGGDYLGELRAAQAAELAASLDASAPAFVMGDMNDDPGSAMHQVLERAGFRDVWADLHPETTGYTASHATNLSDPVAHFTRRIDFVWARGFAHPVAGLEGQITRIGTEPSERVAGPYYKIWASDHAGLVVELPVPPPAEPGG